MPKGWAPQQKRRSSRALSDGIPLQDSEKASPAGLNGTGRCNQGEALPQIVLSHILLKDIHNSSAHLGKEKCEDLES